MIDILAYVAVRLQAAKSKKKKEEEEDLTPSQGKSCHDGVTVVRSVSRTERHSFRRI
jgi:hypothetical protein